MTNNTFVGCSSVVTNEPYGTAAQTIAPTLTNDQSFALNAANAPAVPNWSAGTPTAIAPAPTVTPTFTATPESDGVELALPAGGGTLTWTATGNTGNPLSDPTSDETNTTVIPAGTTSYVDTSVPNNWQVYYTFSGSQGGVLTTTAANQISAPSTTPTPTVTATATTTAALTATAGTDGVHLTLPTGGGTLTWTATGNTGSPLTNPTSGETNSITIPPGTASFVDTSVPDSWQVYYTFSGAPGQSALVTTVPTQVFSSGSTTTPVVSTTPVNDVTPVVSTSPTTSAASDGWTDGDLGPTVSAGSSAVTGGVFTVNSPVADTTQSPVASHFVYQTLGQNGSIVVNVSGVEGTAGLKLASGLQSGDPTASLLTDANGNITFTTQAAPARPALPAPSPPKATPG